jgi:hypothetical protein
VRGGMRSLAVKSPGTKADCHGNDAERCGLLTAQEHDTRYILGKILAYLYFCTIVLFLVIRARGRYQ